MLDKVVNMGIDSLVNLLSIILVSQNSVIWYFKFGFLNQIIPLTYIYVLRKNRLSLNYGFCGSISLLQTHTPY